MRVRITYLLPLLFFTLASCSLFLSPEERAQKLAVETAVAYFNFDYQHPENWMEPVQESIYYQEFLAPQVLPALTPTLQKYFIKSSAVLVSVEEFARGVNSDNAEVIIWKIIVQVNPVWPGSQPPAPLNESPTKIPWTDGELTTVYGAAASRYGVWNVKLIPTDEVEKVASSLATP